MSWFICIGPICNIWFHTFVFWYFPILCYSCSQLKLFTDVYQYKCTIATQPSRPICMAPIKVPAVAGYISTQLIIIYKFDWNWWKITHSNKFPECVSNNWWETAYSTTYFLSFYALFCISKENYFLGKQIKPIN